MSLSKQVGLASVCVESISTSSQVVYTDDWAMEHVGPLSLSVASVPGLFSPVSALCVVPSFALYLLPQVYMYSRYPIAPLSVLCIVYPSL